MSSFRPSDGVGLADGSGDGFVSLEGVGGPHQGFDMVWPMAIAMRALTAYDAAASSSAADQDADAVADAEVEACLAALLESSAGSGLLHESFFVDDPRQFTRPWFAWVNGLFGDLVNRLIDTRPWLVLRDY